MTFGTPTPAKTNLTPEQIDEAIVEFRSPAGGTMPGGVTLNGETIFCEMVHESTTAEHDEVVIFRSWPEPDGDEPAVYFGFKRMHEPGSKPAPWTPLIHGLQEPATWPSTLAGDRAVALMTQKLILLDFMDVFQKDAQLVGGIQDLKLGAPQVADRLQHGFVGLNQRRRAPLPRVEFPRAVCSLSQDELRKLWETWLEQGHITEESPLDVTICGHEVALGLEYVLADAHEDGTKTMVLGGMIMDLPSGVDEEALSSALVVYRQEDKAAEWQLWPKAAVFNEAPGMGWVSSSWVAAKLLEYAADTDYEMFYLEVAKSKEA